MDFEFCQTCDEKEHCESCCAELELYMQEPVLSDVKRKMEAIQIAKAYSRLFPMATFMPDDRPLREIIIDLCYEQKLNLDETDCLLESIR